MIFAELTFAVLGCSSKDTDLSVEAGELERVEAGLSLVANIVESLRSIWCRVSSIRLSSLFIIASNHSQKSGRRNALAHLRIFVPFRESL